MNVIQLSPLLVHIALWLKVIVYTPFYSLYTVWMIDAQRGISAAGIRPLFVNCCGLGHREVTRDILLWLMTDDTRTICDL